MSQMIEDTMDDISTDVFDTDSFKEESTHTESKNVLFSTPFSRSVGDLEQLQEDVQKFRKSKARRSFSLKKFDVNEVYFEKAHRSVDNWLKKLPVHKESLQAPTSPSVPLSPSCFRQVRKQSQIHQTIPKEMLSIDLSSVKSQLIRNSPKKKRYVQQFSPQTSDPSRKNETSEEVSALGTLDEYSNSIFIEDDDPTVGDQSDFGDDCLSDCEMNDENKFQSNFAVAQRARSQESKSPQRKNDIIPEAVTFNPLFNSRRAHCLIESKKQVWRVPDEETTISHENPLFKNAALHYKLVKDSVAWQIPSDTPKNKRRFFSKRQSLSDILQYRALKSSETQTKLPKGTPDPVRRI